MTDQEFDRIIEKSVRTHGNEYFDTTAPSHDFSDRFQQKMNRLLSARQKKHRTIRRIAAAAAAVAAAACICVAVLRLNILSDQTPVADSDQMTMTASAPRSASSSSSAAADESQDGMPPVYDNALPEQHDQTAKSIQNAAAAEENEGIQAQEDAQEADHADDYTHDRSITTGSASATLTRRGQSVSLTAEQAAAISDIVVGWIVNHELLPDTEQSAVLPAPGQTAYSISVNSTDGSPLLYDENENPVYQLTITLDGDSGCIRYDHTQQVFPFRLEHSEEKYNTIENLITG